MRQCVDPHVLGQKTMPEIFRTHPIEHGIEPIRLLTENCLLPRLLLEPHIFQFELSALTTVPFVFFKGVHHGEHPA